MSNRSVRTSSRLAVLACGALLAVPACGTSDSDDAASEPDTDATVDTDNSTEATTDTSTESTSSTAPETAAPDDEVSTDTGCDDVAALFVTRGSANPDLDDPEVSATCDGDDLVVTSNAIPDFTYIETSPGSPRGDESTYTIPASPTLADEVTAIPYIGSAAVTLSGIPIFGPTEGTGGDVDSLPGIISVCGSHNGPGGFHTHKILASEETDCFFTPEEVAAAPQLAGYAFDGFPIYTGVDQFTSSWQLTDESLFASDTWAAHTYVEGSGDLDQCNGRYDENGDYAYYTTETFPYLLGCFMGEVEVQEAGGGGGDRPEPPEGGDDADRPEPPEGDAAAGDEDRPERPERPEGDEDGDRPAPPDAGEDGDRPAPPDEGADA